MNNFIAFAKQHVFGAIAAWSILLWVFSAAVSAMDAPSDKYGPFYCWLYRFLHLLVANLDKLRIQLPPGAVSIRTSSEVVKIPDEPNQK